jgi:hypothetical protein
LNSERRLAGVAHVQRAGRVGGDELHHDVLGRGRAVAELRAGRQHLGDDGLLGFGLQADVDEAGAGNLQRLHPGLEGGRGL